MPSDTRKSSVERKQTDESLRVERKNSDHSAAMRRTAVEDDADLLVQRARVTADAVMEVARNRADRLVDHGNVASTDASIVEDRRVEDKILCDERATADETLRMMRE